VWKARGVEFVFRGLDCAVDDVVAAVGDACVLQPPLAAGVELLRRGVEGFADIAIFGRVQRRD